MDLTIKGLKKFLRAQDCSDLASQIESGWCWVELGLWFQGLSSQARERLEPAVEALIASGNGEACCWYCRAVKDRDDVRAALIASGDGAACYWYCRDVKDRGDVRAVARRL